ncbi:MAG: NUDIX hydrolase [Kiritimatiellia bacterium]
MKEKTLSATRVFQGRLLGLDLLEVMLEDGTSARREIVRHPGAVAVLAQHPDGRFIFVRQFRKAVEKPLIEVVAGTKAKGENPLRCARRELFEETGYRAAQMQSLGRIYLAPGYSDEQLWLFFARVGNKVSAPQPDDDEKLEVVFLRATIVEEMIRSGAICDAKTLAAWLLLNASVHNHSKRKQERRIPQRD